MKSIKAIFRRGQNQKIEGPNLPDNLSRTSSVTNLDVEQKVNNKGAKPRKSASRDRIDKLGEPKKNDKKGVTKNNNKLESGDSPYPSIDSLQEEEFLQLRRQLQEMAQEKSNLALQLGEQKGQLNILQKEIQKLKDESNLQLEHLTEENTALRNRLRDVAHSPLSDNEKQQLLYESHRHHSSAPASIATNLTDEGNGGDITACPTPDWDKHSSSNVSEVSVACLQDKINQMQETHYSTNEELQATLQELTDLQRQLTELQQENERLNEEKTLMFDSLCRQTERLNDSRSEVESLKQLLYREKDETGQYESAVEREQKLLDLLKSAQEEREALLVKIEQINNEIQETRAGIIEKDERIMQLSERVRTLESTLDAKHAEHKLLDQELAQAKDQCSGRQIEINRLTDLLDNARTKITELEQDRALSDKSELDELLDNARKEKDALESEVAHLKEQLAISKNEIEKLKEQISVLQEECKVIRNNARTTQSDLEYKCEKLMKEKSTLNDQLQEFQEAVNELQVQSQCQLEDKRQLSAVLSETQRNLSEAEQKNLILENELQELKKLRAEENEEWEKFQNDLLTSVRVANDFKTEAQQELQRMILENKSYRERERQLRSEIDKLKGDFSGANSSTLKLSNKENVPNKEMDSLLKLTRKSRDKPRRSKDTTDTLSSGSKGDKNKDKKPDILPKMVKRREKKPSPSKRNKAMSVEEELLMRSLNDWYENIDKNTPEDKLTEEEKVVRKLKTLYEDEGIKEKPVAHKPKDQLAISKPLLDSVFLNPKLEKIARNPNVPTIEEIGKSEVINYGNESPVLRRLPDRVDRAERTKSNDFRLLEKEKRKSIMSRSKSLDDLYILDERDETTVLYRSNETEDLRDQTDLKRVERESSILPSDSVSNPRYSDFALLVNSEEIHRNTNETPGTPTVTRKSSVNHETLEAIVASIPKGVPESQLTGEQKLALKLKKALDEAERKNTLKKQRRKKKKVVISSPLAESVRRNPRLRDILLDPRIKSVDRRRNSETITENPPPLFNETMRQSKSYQDISFTFKADSSRRTVSGCSNESAKDSPMSVGESVSVPDTFSDEEVNSETGIKRFENIRNSLELPFISNAKEEPDLKRAKNEDYDSLTYNETLKKAQDVKRNKSENSGSSDSHIQKILIVNVSRHTREDRNRDISQDIDLLYNETLKKNRQSEADATDRIAENTSSGRDSDLIYNETLNKKTELYVNKEVNLDQGPVVSEARRDKKIRDLHNLSKQQQPLEMENDFEEAIINNKSVFRNIIGESGSVVDREGGNQELIHVETLNKKVRIPNSEILQEKEHSRIQIAEEIDLIRNADYHLEDIKTTTYEDLPTQIEDEDIAWSLEMCDIRNKINDNFSKVLIDVSTDIVDHNASTEEGDEYNYQSILKENRFGVTSPLNIRLVYKDVVQEIKHKFPHEDIKEDPNEDEDDNDGVEQSDTFFDEFFGVKPKREHVITNVSDDATNSVDEIDKEMEEIFERYLHTPLSKVITRIEENEDTLNKNDDQIRSSHKTSPPVDQIEQVELSNDNQHSLESSDLVQGHAEERYGRYFKGNDELKQDNHELPNKENVVEDSGSNDQSLEEIMLIIDDTPRNSEQIASNTEEAGAELTEIQDNNSLEVVSIIDKNNVDLKHGSIENSEILEDGTIQMEDIKGAENDISQILEDHSNNVLSIDKALPDDLNKEVILNDKMEKLPDIVESINKNVTYDNIHMESKFDEDKADNRLTVEELQLLRTVQKKRFSRPLSDFCEKDLSLIQEISSRYLPENVAQETSRICESKVIDYEPNVEESTLSTVYVVENLDNNKEMMSNIQKDVAEIVEVNKSEKEENDVRKPDKENNATYREEQVKVDLHENIDNPPIKSKRKNLEPISKGSSENDNDNDLNAILTRMLVPSKRQTKRRNRTNDENLAKEYLEETPRVNKSDAIEIVDLKTETNSKGDVVDHHEQEEIPLVRDKVVDEREESNLELHDQDSSQVLITIPSPVLPTENDGTEFDNEQVATSKPNDMIDREEVNASEILNEPGISMGQRDSTFKADKLIDEREESIMELHDQGSSNVLVTIPSPSLPTENDGIEFDNKEVTSKPNDVIDREGVDASEILNESDMSIEQRDATFRVEERKSSYLDVFLTKPVILDYSPTMSNSTKVDDVAPMEYWQQSVEDEIFIETQEPTINLNRKSSISVELGAYKIEKNEDDLVILTPERNIHEISLLHDGKLKSTDDKEHTVDAPKDDEKEITMKVMEEYKTHNRDLNKVIGPNISATKDIISKSNADKLTTDTKISSVESSRIISLKERSGTRIPFMRDYKGVKDRLQYFSRNADSPPPSGRQSLRTYSGRSGLDHRKVKSWAEHFEKRSLDTPSYEPVYANFSSLMSSRSAPMTTAKIEKKPLPVPRLKNQNSQLDVTNYDNPESPVKHDISSKEIKMNDPENFSEQVAKDIIQEVAANVLQEVGCTENLEVRPDASGNHEVPKLFLGAAMLAEEDNTRLGHPIAIKKSEKFLDVPTEDCIKTTEDDDQINFAYGAESSLSTIAVAGKVEQLDITKNSNYDIEEMDNSNNQSKLNLFHIETPSYDESYLSLFKQPEDKLYDDITGQKKPQRGFFNIAYLGEVSDNDSFDDMLKNKGLNNPSLGVPKSKPKIIDFVPLDDATKPVFKKNNMNIPDYDTLEREKTFQILNSAPSKVKVRQFSKVDGSKTSLSSGSSFSAAKKVFEALLEANSEKQDGKPKLSKKKDPVYEIKEKIDMGRSSSSSAGLLNKQKMEEKIEK